MLCFPTLPVAQVNLWKSNMLSSYPAHIVVLSQWVQVRLLHVSVAHSLLVSKLRLEIIDRHEGSEK